MNNNGVNSIEVKKINRQIIYKFLYKHEPISIQEIAHTLNMSLPTVTQNIKELHERGLVIKTGLFKSTGGRKAKAISYNSTARYAIGLDVTRNHIGAVLIDLSGKVIKNEKQQFPFVNSKEYFKGVGDFVRDFIKDYKIMNEDILGIGIALPAIISPDRETVSYATVIDFKGGNVNAFTEYMSYPCIFSNDANAAGFAEMWGEETSENVVYLSLNNSVGGSIIIGKNIYEGYNNRSGEFGHMTIVPNGRTCYCGKKGCVDAYCSAKILSDTTNGNIAEFFRLLSTGSEPQRSVWDEYVSHLVIALNNLRMLFDCRVILGGYAGAYMDEYLEQLRERVSEYNTFEEDGSYLSVCKYKLETTAVGAALILVEDFIKNV
ncbi:putative NBD/HSP70 family sugar kinase [Ruminiclostridium sufflavum DSM 19573]|uniref:Putative NBD/HSP70 family sugar kinase n=1 Tax=Ruminiclostridium sufflavum DSM 19573 TaxID=1121337 RepID=A0A318XIU3_9FIRM|nr:ROK family transcriptional regulator [Ruminiclostridium sufflavum]PYG87105.1 putative NBD/HSP70 family sugar kinase [Ruminiclostridium sufflavum DSM 19573]